MARTASNVISVAALESFGVSKLCLLCQETEMNSVTPLPRSRKGVTVQVKSRFIIFFCGWCLLLGSGFALGAPSLSHFTYAAQFGNTYLSANNRWGRGQEIDVARNGRFEETELVSISDAYGLSEGWASADSLGVLRAHSRVANDTGRIWWASEAWAGESISMFAGATQDPWSGRVFMAASLAGAAIVGGADSDLGTAAVFFRFRAFHPSTLENCLRLRIPNASAIDDSAICLSRTFFSYDFFADQDSFRNAFFRLEFDAPANFEWIAELQAYSDTGEGYIPPGRVAIASFGNSAHLSLEVPDGVRFESGSGVFRGSSAVPVPSSLALALLGLLFIARFSDRAPSEPRIGKPTGR